MKSYILLLSVVAIVIAAKSDKKSSKIKEKILGGTSVNINAALYQASIQQDGKGHFCGGSVISDKYVITAAHCVSGMKANKLFVKTGSTDSRTGGDDTRVAKIIVHPKWTKKTRVGMDDDIALLEMETAIPNASPIEIASEEPEDGAQALITGWGKKSNLSLMSSRNLQYAYVPVKSRTWCKVTNGYFMVTDNMICAGYHFKRVDACQGDSGGPMVVDGKLVGLVSWGYGCALPLVQGVYTNVANYRDWINKETGV